MYLFFYIIHIQSNHESISTQEITITKKDPSITTVILESLRA